MAAILQSAENPEALSANGNSAPWWWEDGILHMPTGSCSALREEVGQTGVILFYVCVRPPHCQDYYTVVS